MTKNVSAVDNMVHHLNTLITATVEGKDIEKREEPIAETTKNEETTAEEAKGEANKTNFSLKGVLIATLPLVAKALEFIKKNTMEKEKQHLSSDEMQKTELMATEGVKRVKRKLKSPQWLCGTVMGETENKTHEAIQEETKEVKKGLQEIFTDFGTSLDYPDEAQF